MSAAAADRRPRIAVVADDLMWATRLAEAVRRAGGEPVAVRAPAGVDAGLAGAAGVIVDTAVRACDALAVLRSAAAAGVPAIAVAPHEDVALRRAARAAGAAKVHPYRVLYERGEQVLTAWFATLAPAEEATK